MVVHYVAEGSPARYMGYTTNVSHAGMFISSSHLPNQGLLIALEVSVREQTIRAEGEVVRQRVVPLALRTVQPSGFAVRFVGDASQLGALLPPDTGAASQSLGGFGAEGPSARPGSTSGPAPLPAGGGVPLPVAPAGSMAVPAAPPVDGTLIRLKLSGPIALAELLRRELRFGAVFVANALKDAGVALGRGAPVTIEVTLGGRSVRVVGRVAATVANGVTVALTDLNGATEALQGLAP